MNKKELLSRISKDIETYIKSQAVVKKVPAKKVVAPKKVATKLQAVTKEAVVKAKPKVKKSVKSTKFLTEVKPKELTKMAIAKKKR